MLIINQFFPKCVNQLEEEGSPVLKGTAIPLYIISHLRFSLLPDLKHEIVFLRYHKVMHET